MELNVHLCASDGVSPCLIRRVIVILLGVLSNLLSLLCPFYVSFALVFCFLFFVFNVSEPQRSRGGQAKLGQPIAVTRTEGVPPGRVGFQVSRDLLACLAYLAR